MCFLDEIFFVDIFLTVKVDLSQIKFDYSSTSPQQFDERIDKVCGSMGLVMIVPLVHD